SVRSPARRNTAILGLGGAGFASAFEAAAGLVAGFACGDDSSPRTGTAGHTTRPLSRPATVASRTILPQTVIMDAPSRLSPSMQPRGPALRRAGSAGRTPRGFLPGPDPARTPHPRSHPAQAERVPAGATGPTGWDFPSVFAEPESFLPRFS